MYDARVFVTDVSKKYHLYGIYSHFLILSKPTFHFRNICG